MTHFSVKAMGAACNKSNRYQIVRKGAHLSLAKDPTVAAFEDTIVAACREVLLREHHHLPVWGVPPGLKREACLNPLFPKGTLVRMDVVIRRSRASGIDFDGVKSVADALTKAGVWADDRYGRTLRVDIVDHAGEDSVAVTVVPFVPAASKPAFYMPVVMARREWSDIKALDAERPRSAAERIDEQVVIEVFCCTCGLGIGKNTMAETPSVYYTGDAGIHIVCEHCVKGLARKARKAGRNQPVFLPLTGGEYLRSAEIFARAKQVLEQYRTQKGTNGKSRTVRPAA